VVVVVVDDVEVVIISTVPSLDKVTTPLESVMAVSKSAIKVSNVSMLWKFISRSDIPLIPMVRYVWSDS